MPGTIVLAKLTTSAAARRAGVSEQSIRSWARSGLLPVEQTPLGMLIDVHDLDEVLADRAIVKRQGTGRERRRWGLTEGVQARAGTRPTAALPHRDAAGLQPGEGAVPVSSPHITEVQDHAY